VRLPWRRYLLSCTFVLGIDPERDVMVVHRLVTEGREGGEGWGRAGPVVVMGWWRASHAQTSPSGGFQGGVVLATAFILVYLSGEFLVFKRFSPVALTDVVEAVGAGGFAAVGVAAVPWGAAVPARSDPSHPAREPMMRGSR